MIVKCTGITCKYNKNRICTKDNIELEDFEYYKDYQGEYKNETEDDMKCKSYELNENWLE